MCIQSNPQPGEINSWSPLEKSQLEEIKNKLENAAHHLEKSEKRLSFAQNILRKLHF